VGGSWGDNEVYTRSWKCSNHCCCSTNKASNWMECRTYTGIFSVKCLVVLTFLPDIALVGIVGISCRIPSMSFTAMNRTMVIFYPRSYFTNPSIWQRKVGCVLLWFLLFSQVSWDRRCSETPRSMTKEMDIRGLHSVESHCYLQYSWLYFTAFEITM